MVKTAPFLVRPLSERVIDLLREEVDYIANRDKGVIDSPHSPVEAYNPEDVLKLIQDNGTESGTANAAPLF